MSSTTSTETVNTSTEETSGQEDNTNTDTTTEATTETVVDNTGTESTSEQDGRLSDDHPLVKSLAARKDELKQLKASSDAKVQELEDKLTRLAGQATSMETAQAKYDRLESFLTSLGGPISKVLDSKSFSTSLFESDTDVKELVAQWHRDNPSSTSQALNSGTGDIQSAKGMNALLRRASS